jgi:2'-5' RNA ligase
MGYAVELYLDERCEALIRGIWEKLAQKGLSDKLLQKGHRPHVALSVFDDVDPGDLIDELRKLAQLQAPVEARFESLGTFCSSDGVLFLVPVLSPRLFLLHSTVNKLLSQLAVGLKESCRPNRFVPHCTIAYGLEKESLAKTVALFSNKALPIIGAFDRIGLMDLGTNQDRCIYPFLKKSEA